MIYLVLLYLLLYFFLAWRRLDWAVLIIIAALPSYLIRFKIFSAPFTLLEVMILISFGAWFLKNYKKIIENLKLRIKNRIRNSELGIRNFRRYPFDVEIILLLIISFSAVGISGFSDSALGIWKAYFFEPILLFIIIINVFKASDIGKIIWAFLISALAVSLAAVYQKITGSFIFNEFLSAEETRRVVSFFGYPNAVGLYLGPVILLLLGFLAEKIRFFKNQKSDKDRKIFNFQFSIFNFKTLIIFLAITFSVVAVYFAKSEGALVGIGAGLIVFGLLAGKKLRLITIALVLLVAVAASFYQPVRYTAYKYLALNNFSGQIRKLQWRETWKMLKDGRIITGAGLANYQKSVAPYHQEGFFYNQYDDPDFRHKVISDPQFRKKVWQPLEIYLYPHNIFLNFWSELGLPGMILFVWITGNFFYVGLKIIENCKLKIENFKMFKEKYIIFGLLGAMTVIVIHGLVDVPYFKNDLAVIFWVLVAMLGIIDLEIKKSKV